MRSLTLLSVLIASYLANPVVHFENNLVRRASNTKQEDVQVDADVNTDIKADVNIDENRMVESRRGHSRGRLLDGLYLGGLVDYILYLIGLYDYEDVKDNGRLLGLLVDNGDISEEEAEEVGGINLLGLFRDNGYGLLSKLINLDAAVASDQNSADKRRKMTQDSKDTVAAGVSLLDGDDVNNVDA